MATLIPSTGSYVSRLSSENAIQIMTMKVTKGLGFPVVPLPGLGHMPAAGVDEPEAALVFYLAATLSCRHLRLNPQQFDNVGLVRR